MRKFQPWVEEGTEVLVLMVVVGVMAGRGFKVVFGAVGEGLGAAAWVSEVMAAIAGMVLGGEDLTNLLAVVVAWVAAGTTLF
ncbi:hypothetical protein INR49_025317 [Caranx melampygus]|nr:hypothetical protein INR49_025317 [Caranx melampygus]